MVAGIDLNMGYNNNPYMILPLSKTNGVFTVECSTPIKEPTQELMNNLDDIKKADADGNNIVSLYELKNLEGKTEFAQTILEMMEKFAQNRR